MLDYKVLDEIQIYGINLNFCMWCTLPCNRILFVKEENHYWGIRVCLDCTKIAVTGNQPIYEATIKELFYLRITGKLC